MSFIIPKFLKRFDDYLLINHPIIWISKIHYVLFFTLIVTAVTSLIAFAIPITVSSSDNFELLHFLFIVVGIVMLCFWVYKNAIHNHEKSYGKRSFWDEYKIFGLYYLCVMMIFSFSYTFSMIYNLRLSNIINDKDFVELINTANLLEPVIGSDNNYAYEVAKVEESIIQIDDSSNQVTEPKYIFDLNYYRFDTHTPYRLNDSLKMSEYNIISGYELRKKFDQIKDDKAAILELITRFTQLTRKINIKVNPSPESLYDAYSAKREGEHELDYIYDDLYTNTDKAYNYYGSNSYLLDDTMNKITKHKFGESFIYDGGFQLFLVIAYFMIVLFYMTFRNVHWLHFILTLVVLIFYPILTLIISIFARGDYMNHTQEKVFFFLQILVYIIALVFTIVFASNRKALYSGFTSICLQIVNLGAPFFFFAIFGYLVEFTDVIWDRSHYYDYNYDNSYVDYKTKENALLYTLIGNIILYILVFMPLMKELFIKLRSLPRNK